MAVDESGQEEARGKAQKKPRVEPRHMALSSTDIELATEKQLGMNPHWGVGWDKETKSFK